MTFGDLASGDITLTPEVAAGINIDLHLRTGIAGATTDLPSILGTFALTWDIGTFVEDPTASTFVDLAGATLGTPSVSFDNLHLDLGDVARRVHRCRSPRRSRRSPGHSSRSST